MLKNFPIYSFIALITILLSNCKKDNNKTVISSSTSKGKLVLIHGSGQSGIYGQDLQDSLVIKIIPPLGKQAAQYSISVSFSQGNGLIENISSNKILTNSLQGNGTIQFKWRLGCNNSSQKIVLSLFSDSVLNYDTGGAKGVADDSLTISASGTKPTGWGRACGCGTLSYNAKITSFDKRTLYMANNGLYSSVDGGTNWSMVTGVPNWNTVTDVQFNNKGWMYVMTANNGIYYSSDYKTWQAINNGLLDTRTPTTFLVSDNLLFVSFYFDGPYISTNNGSFWQKLIVGYGSQRFYLAKQHPNGTIYLFNDWTQLLSSKDTGKTWQLISTSSQEVNYQAYDMEIGPNGMIYIGSDDATIATIAPQTNQGIYKSFYQYNSSTQPTNNIEFYNNDTFFLLNANTQPGIYSINSGYNMLNLNFNKTITSYYIKNDGTFLLYSYDGLYYNN